MFLSVDLIREPKLQFLVFPENEPLLIAQIFSEMDKSVYEHDTEMLPG